MPAIAAQTVPAKSDSKPAKDTIAQADSLAQSLTADFLAQNIDALQKSAHEALPILEKGVAGSAHRDRIYFAMFLCYMIADQKQKMIDCVDKAYHLDPDNPVYTTYYALTLKLRGRNLEARDLYAQLSSKSGHPDGLEVMVAGLDMALQKYDEAIPIFLKLASAPQKRSPLDQATLNYMLGDCYLYQGQYEKALEYLNRSVETQSTVVGMSYLGEATLKSGDPAKSLDIFDRALHDNPDYEPVFYYKGIALEKLGRAGEAKPLYQHALTALQERLKDTTDQGDKYILLGLIQTKLGNPEASRQAFASAKRLGYTHEAPYKP